MPKWDAATGRCNVHPIGNQSVQRQPPCGLSETPHWMPTRGQTTGPWIRKRRLEARSQRTGPTATNTRAASADRSSRTKRFSSRLWDGCWSTTRRFKTRSVLTPCARNGIFRYFDTWNNGNYHSGDSGSGRDSDDRRRGRLRQSARARRPIRRTAAPFTGRLRYASVFGPLQNTPTQPDCSDAVVQGAPWDSNRKALDSDRLC